MKEIDVKLIGVKPIDGKLIDIDVKLLGVKVIAFGGGPPGCVVPSLAGQTPPGGDSRPTLRRVRSPA